METQSQPFLSIIVPVRNEAASLPLLLSQLLEQTYPADCFEILVVDGCSTDGTREQVLACAAKHAALGRIRLIHNSGIRSGAGRNAGVLAATGSILIFIDGHCELPSRELLTNTARLMEQTGAACLCRPQPLLAHSPRHMGATIATVRASWLGHGRDSLIYNLEHAGFVDPASSGATYRRDVFTQLGLYDESFDACEDVEFNTRVRKASLAAYTHPDLAVYYQPRDTLRGLWAQMVRYGRGRGRLMRKHPDTFSAAQIAPMLLSLSCMLAPAAFLLSPWAGVACGLGGILFLLAIAVCSVQIAQQHGTRTAMLAPAVFLAIYGGLGAGLLLELSLSLPRLRRRQTAVPAEPNSASKFPTMTA